MSAAVSPEADSPGSRSVPGWRRLLRTLSGWLIAGVLVWGVALLGLQLLGPLVFGGNQPISRADGPSWVRVIAHLVVGVGGELLLRWSSRRSPGLRVAVDLTIIVLVFLLLWLGWWW